MSDETTAPAGDDTVVSYAVPSDAPAEMSVSEAARLLSQSRRKQFEAPPVASADPATTEPKLAEQANAAPEEGTTAEDPEGEPEIPAIEPPRSWTKEARERWSTLDRETQEYLASRDSEDQKAIKRNLNEVAEQRKAVEAERSKAEQARTEYEGKLKGVVEQLTEVNNTQFSHIKSQADLDFLISEVGRLAQAGQVAESQQVQAYLTAWQAHQNKLVARTQELRQIEEQNAQKTASEWSKFAEEENGKFLETLSEADKTKLESRLKDAPDFLEERGFDKQELIDLWNGKSKISLRDHRIQALILDGLKLREIQAAPLKAIPKPVPPVQRPGTARDGNPSVSTHLQNLETQLSKATGNQALKLAAEITRIKRSAAR